MKQILSAVTFVSVVVALSAGLLPGAEIPGLAKQAAADSNRFATDLLARLSRDGNDNLIFSPYSIETALAMTSAGARGNTAAQMAQVLHFDLADKLSQGFGELSDELNAEAGDASHPFSLAVANALWAQQGFDINPDFAKVVKDQYRAQLASLDFASGDAAREKSRQIINEWVEKQTNAKIKDLLPNGSLTGDTRLVLTNAIYFKSSWANPFQSMQTHDETFHSSSQASRNVPMMHQTHDLPFMENDSLSAVELPYNRRSLWMVVLLPKKADGLSELTRSLTNESLDAWEAAMSNREVDLSLPKFKFTSHLGLAPTLASMGMSDAFDPKADFSGISTNGKLYIQHVIHQAFIAVDEKGTEAAAATGVTMGLMSIRRPAEKAVFRADHPFLFIIRDRTCGAILFVGRVVDPK